MADFIYRFDGAESEAARFGTRYKEQQRISASCDVFYNGRTITRITDGADQLTLLGYVYKIGDDADAYLQDLLKRFTSDRIAEAKKVLLGQYTILLSKGDRLYLFSDFLQVRSIYYDEKRGIACSSFPVLHGLTDGKTDEYKVFEYLAMRHCSYPAWLGNTTLDPDIKRVRACEYLIIDTVSGKMEIADLRIDLDNTKAASLKATLQDTLSTLRAVVRHPSRRESKIQSTMTGGFDSRFVTALVREYYPDVNLRISTYTGKDSLDCTIASEVAAALSLPLKVHETDLQGQKDTFYELTDGLAPKENSIITQLLLDLDDETLGFGGTFGTELYTSFSYGRTDELAADYALRAREQIEADGVWFEQFEAALCSEFEYIREHYMLKNPDDRDYMRLFRLINTGYFSSRLGIQYLRQSIRTFRDISGR